jgi:putative radical SAM enzyme (TIGR03279 family)
MKIIEVEKDSIGSKAGLLAGDELVMINTHRLRDCIDYTYHASEDTLSLQIQREGKILEFEVGKDPYEYLGLRLEPMSFRECNNHCIFCFIDQLPTGLRSPLYFKDEDYRLSFLHGSYITLTGISEQDLDRIREQRLSPLYISVHSTDPQLRQKMLRGKEAVKLLERIEYLTRGGIELHTQVVLCPGVNDGPHLEQTIRDLSRFFPQVRSVAVVPVGVTKHRQGLYTLQSIGPDYARTIIETLQPQQTDFRRTLGETFLYLADELYVLAGIEIPDSIWYDDFPQVENGVGMIRQFLNLLTERQGELPAKLERPLELTLITGQSAHSFMSREVLPVLSKIENLRIEMTAVANTFFGPSVTVSGLLTGTDIVDTLTHEGGNGIVLLPPNCLNEDGLLLDDVTLGEMESKLHRRVALGTYDVVESMLQIIGSSREGGQAS